MKAASLKNRTWPAVAQTGAVLCLLILFAAQMLYLAASNSTVSDEVAHLVSGYAYLKEQNFNLNPEHPPFVKQLAAIPLLFMDLKFPPKDKLWQENEQWQLGRKFLFTLGNPAELMIFWARAALLPISILLGLVLFFWTSEIWGKAAGFFTLALWSVSPELLIHGSLVTTDYAAATFYLATFFCLWRFEQTAKLPYLAASGLAGGLALVSKFSMILILPLFYFFAWRCAHEHTLGTGDLRRANSGPVTPGQFRFPLPFLALVTAVTVLHKYTAMVFWLPLFYFWLDRFLPGRRFLRNPLLNRALGYLLILLCVSFAVIALDYFEYHYWFEKFRPFKRFFRGFEIFRGHSLARDHFGYLFNQTSKSGWWYYYPVAMLVKYPLALLMASGIGGIALFRDRRDFKISSFTIFIALPVLAYLFVACFVNTVNIGVRHVLPVYPFLLLLAGAGFHVLTSSRFFFSRTILPSCLLVWMILSSMANFPHHLSYFNELASLLGGKENILSDSNISWGQDVKRLRNYVKKNGIRQIRTLLYFNDAEELNYYGIPAVNAYSDLTDVKPGLYVMDTSTYQGIHRSGDMIIFLNLRPKHRVGSLWFYEI